MLTSGSGTWNVRRPRNLPSVVWTCALNSPNRQHLAGVLLQVLGTVGHRCQILAAAFHVDDDAGAQVAAIDRSGWPRG